MKDNLMLKKYTWVPFYEEFADELLKYKNNREKLVDKLLDALKNAHKKNSDIKEIPNIESKEGNSLTDIDPFSIYSLINKGSAQRSIIVSEIKKEFRIKADEPNDYHGVPVRSSLSAWYVAWKNDRGQNDIDNLWKLFEYAIDFADNGTNQDNFVKYFSTIPTIKSSALKSITMALFWIRPSKYINLDGTNIQSIKTHYSENVFNKINDLIDKYKKNVADGKQYLCICDLISKENKDKGIDNVDFSYLAWNEGNKYKTLASCADKLKRSYNIILHGAPGTGKTFLARQIAYNLIYDKFPNDDKKLDNVLKNDEHYCFVQFHPSYDYTDFIEGIRPVVEESGIVGFEGKKGVFREFCEKAQGSKDNFVMVIDEINRGEISRIFGELFFSIDPGYRGVDGRIDTQYKNMFDDYRPLRVPENVYIIGTMNDIDRSVDTFDFAIRRRFKFIEITLKETINMLDGKDYAKEAEKRLTEINKVIEAKLNRNFSIGPAYFLKLDKDKLDGDFTLLWRDYLGPLVREYLRGRKDEEEDYKDIIKAYFTKEEIHKAKDEIKRDGASETPSDDEAIDYIIRKTLTNGSKAEETAKILEQSYNIVLHGAPGTGKTFLARQLAYYLITGKIDDSKQIAKGLENNEQYCFVQFHPSYDYTDFVEGLRPEKDGGFKATPGIFKEFALRAQASKNQNKKYVIVIDEINRGEISKIFGELFFSIDPDYRGKGEVKTALQGMYSKEDDIYNGNFYVPDNLYVIGTMNDIDRSVDSFDFAMRRRFRFINIRAKDFARKMITGKYKDAKIEVMDKLNKEIANNSEVGLGEMYEIGPSYFSSKTDVKGIWNIDIEPLIREYLRGRPEKDIDNIVAILKGACLTSKSKSSKSDDENETDEFIEDDSPDEEENDAE